MKKMILGVLIVWFFVSGAGLSLASGFHSAWKHYRACCIQPDGRVKKR